MNDRTSIRGRRVALGLSRPELGRLAGNLSHETVRNAESTDRPMNDATVGRILRALDDAEAARLSPAGGTDPALRAELDALRTEVHALSAQVFELLELMRLRGVDAGKQPGGLQGLQVPPATRRSPA